MSEYNYEVPRLPAEPILSGTDYQTKLELYGSYLVRWDRISEIIVAQVTSDVIRTEKSLDESASADPRLPYDNQVAYIWIRDGGKCVYCPKTLFYLDQVSPDHLVPVARGGKTRVDNLVCSCRPCNIAKGVMTPGEYSERLSRPDGLEWRGGIFEAWRQDQRLKYGYN